VIAAVRTPIGKAPRHPRRDDDGPSGRIDARQPRTRRLPGVIGDQRHVVQPLRRHAAERFDVLRPGAEGAVGEVGHLSRRRIDAPIQLGQDVVVELVGTSRPDGPAAVDPQLFEIPPPGGHVGNLSGPHPVGGARESRDRTAAGQPRRRVGRRLVADRARGRAAVVWRQHERFLHRVLAFGHQNLYRFAERPLGLEFADGIARSGQRGQRAVGPIRVGLRQPARPGVVARRGHVQRGGGRRTPRGEDDHRRRADIAFQDRTHCRFLLE